MIETSKYFNEDIAEKLNSFQDKSKFHPFTCAGKNCIRDKSNDFGKLIATETGWVCPCGDYKQDWYHKFMIK